jgi:LPPG:FO 2-phospho-L-lactate transferase
MKVALLAGGTGGAKLAHGFAQVLEPGELSVIANVGDDTELHGLHVSPDIDSILYTLAGLLNRDTGWGVAGDTRTALGMLERLGAERTWFQIGDADLALHVRRSALLRSGSSLTDATAAITAALGIDARVLPATDDRLRTMIQTDAGELDFQDYFVGHRQGPAVTGIRLDGAETAGASAVAVAAVREADLVVIGPSNPVVSIGPILAIPGMHDALLASHAAIVAVSPIIGGRALKGPADRMLSSLGHESSALGVARLYAGLAGTFVLDEQDAAHAPEIEELGIRAVVMPTVMGEGDGRAVLARSLVELGSQLLG